MRFSVNPDEPSVITHTSEMPLTPSKENVTFIIPTLNEEKAIGKVIDEIREAGFDRIVVVDGRSKDRTADIARSRGARVLLQKLKGKTEAVKLGIANAQTEFVALIDGDGSYDPVDVEKMLEFAPAYDEIIGRRGSARIPAPRRLGNRIVSFLVRSFTRTKLDDVCSGLYLLRTGKAKHLLLTKNGFSTEVEIVFGMSRIGAVCQVPINYRERIGNSKLSLLRHGPQIVLSIFDIAREKPLGRVFNGDGLDEEQGRN